MIRNEVRAALVEAVRAGVETLGAVVYPFTEYGSPAGTRVTFIEDDVQGVETAVTAMDGGPKRWRDSWRLLVYCRAAQGLQPAATAAQLAQDLATAVVTAIHADPSLGGLTKTAGSLGSWRNVQALVTLIQGPEVGQYADGAAGLCIVTVSCSAAIYR